MSRKIIGVTVGTQLPKPNFKQTDPTKGDYIKNKPNFEGLESRVDAVSELVGDSSVSTQINNAISALTADEVGIYVQKDEPTNVEDGDIWVDMSADSAELTNHTHDNRYYTEEEIDNKLANMSVSGGYTHPKSGVVAGTYKSVTVNDEGHVTDGANPTTLEGYGITDAATKAELEEVSTLVGDTSVSEQIRTALDTTVDTLLESVVYTSDSNENIETEVQGDGSSIIIDDELSSTSTNPVQNKIITNEIIELSEKVDNVSDYSVMSRPTITVNLGDELIDSTRLPTFGTNWSGDYENGFHHAAGSTSSLSFINHAQDINCDYILEFDTDYTSGEFVNVGFDDSYKILAYKGTSHIILPLRATTKNLRFVPYENIEFTISNISLKKIQTHGTEKEIEIDSILSKDSISNYGFWNVILGVDTMENAVGSTRCIAIGRAALNELQGGHRNVAIGTFSMGHLTGGEENIAIGADSMFSVGAGDGNIAIGRGAMNNGAEATRNIAIGFKALNCSATSTPVSNIAIGGYAGNYITTGDNNIMLGENAGYNIRSGKRNICIGTTARGANTGNRNVCIGSGSGYSDGVENSIAIGRDVIATASNQVMIGRTDAIVILGGRKLIFNDDGTVTWETIT